VFSAILALCTLSTAAMLKFDPELSTRQFGVEVARLTNDERTVPLVVEKLINYIEMHGLYTEGIYRKSGSTNKIKEWRDQKGFLTLPPFDLADVENMNLDDYNIHVIASVFKQWLRDLPNPLMTFELYEEFIRAMSECRAPAHFSIELRLIGDYETDGLLISFQEETNRMSANALAIVFAPCILRCPDTTDPMQSVQDISKTTA
uniref:Rho-GAP domain-containing protein n=1 Tax=Xiphophorus couchianus TaxID=32473 RepID=A0A3B5MKU9_9TELE